VLIIRRSNCINTASGIVFCVSDRPVGTCNMCIDVSTFDAGLLARCQCSEGPATGHLDTGFSWFPCVYKQMLRWFPSPSCHYMLLM